MAVLTVYASKDASARDANDGWSGYDDHHPVGTLSGVNYRSFIYFPISFSGVTTITDARVWLRAHRAGSGNHVLGASSGQTRTLRLARMTSDWGEGTDRGESVWSSAETWGYNNRADAYTTQYGDRVFTGYTEGTWYDIDVTDIVRYWQGGTSNYGLLLRIASNESTEANALEFYSRQAGSGYKPYIEITYTSNVAPDAPTGLSPTADALVNTLSPTLTGTHSDPDTGDYITAHQVIVYADDGTTQKWDSGTVTATGTPTTFSATYSGPPLTGNTYYKWKARTRDKGSAWGAYSALQRFKVNTPPNQPTVSITETPASDILTLTPTINVTHSDNDVGDSKMYGYRVILTQSDGTSIWDSGDVDTSGAPLTTKTFTYGGPVLAWGFSYRIKARTKDINGVWGSYSSQYNFSTHATKTPSGLSPDGEVTSSLTPTFEADRGDSNDTITSYQIIVYANDGTTQIWDSGTLTTNIVSGASFSKVYAGTALALATTYKWKTRATGSIGGTSAYSSQKSFTTPADTTVPSLSVTPQTSGKVTTLTPTFNGSRATAFTNYQYELYPSTATSSNLGTPLFTSSNISQSSATTFASVYGGAPALAWGTTYKWRARVGAPTLGSYTGLSSFSTDSGGAPTLTAPTHNSWFVPASTAFTGSRTGSDSITSRQVQIYASDGVTLVHDTGMVAQGSATTFSSTIDLTAAPFVPGTTYLWRARYTKSTGPIGPYSAFFSFRLNGAPLIPTELFPTPGYANAGSITPTFKASFEDPDENSNADTPTSWEIEIRNNATDALIQTKTLTTGLNNSLNTYVWGTNTGGADTALAYATVYKWRTRFTDSKSAVGAWSSYQTFSNAQPPTLSSLTPTNGSNVTTTRPTIGWSYSDPGSLAQNKYTVSIYRVSNGTRVYSTTAVSAATSVQIPAGYLQYNTESYRADVTVENSSGVPSSTSSTTFQLQLAAPPAIEGLSATVIEDESRIVLDWDASSLAGAFVTYVIYRRRPGDTDWTMIGTARPESNTTFSDWYAGNSVQYEYRVTVVKLIASEPDLEGPDSDIATASLESDVWMVVGQDRDTTHIFELYVSGESHTRPVQQESFEPLGSNRKAVVRGFVLGHEGSVDVTYQESESWVGRTQIEYLLYYAGPHILKTPFGDVYDVTFGSPDYSYQGGGSLNVTLTWIEVGATNNPGLSPDQFLALIGAT